jgi:hypothetical protein
VKSIKRPMAREVVDRSERMVLSQRFVAPDVIVMTCPSRSHAAVSPANDGDIVILITEVSAVNQRGPLSLAYML